MVKAADVRSDPQGSAVGALGRRRVVTVQVILRDLLEKVRRADLSHGLGLRKEEALGHEMLQSLEPPGFRLRHLPREHPAVGFLVEAFREAVLPDQLDQSRGLRSRHTP
jgi:hypothetical protein